MLYVSSERCWCTRSTYTISTQNARMCRVRQVYMKLSAKNRVVGRVYATQASTTQICQEAMPTAVCSVDGAVGAVSAVCMLVWLCGDGSLCSPDLPAAFHKHVMNVHNPFLATCHRIHCAFVQHSTKAAVTVLRHAPTDQHCRLCCGCIVP